MYKIHYEISRFQILLSECFMNKQPNHCIKCTVVSCANHAKDTNYCVLDTVSIGTHECNPTVSQCVDCESFVLGRDCSGKGCK